jgi:formylglycine-generating enzyme required for sulfatase activity
MRIIEYIGPAYKQPQKVMNIRCSRTLTHLFAFNAALWLVVPSISAQSRPVLSVQVTNGTVRVRITGDVGSNHTIQYCTGLMRTNNWQLLTNLTPLLSSPLSVVDAGATTIPRFYRAFAQPTAPPEVVPVTNMVWISPGAFVMGSPTNETDRLPDETQHTVTLTKGFYMGKYPVTQGEYLSMMSTNPSYFNTNNGFALDLTRPVEEVTWINATNYCARLTQQEQIAGHLPTGWVYRLPTESEREYACRGGTSTRFSYGDDPGYTHLADYAWFFDNSAGTTHPVGQKLANPWGLYEVHGDLSEWCQDWYADYPEGSVTDPHGPASATWRVYRGGSYDLPGRYCRSAQRYYDDPSSNFDYVGFRIVLAQAPP